MRQQRERRASVAPSHFNAYHWYAEMAKDVQIALRLDQETIDMADAVMRELARTSMAGLVPTRSAVMRAALTQGLKDMHRAAKRKRSTK